MDTPQSHVWFPPPPLPPYNPIKRAKYSSGAIATKYVTKINKERKRTNHTKKKKTQAFPSSSWSSLLLVLLFLDARGNYYVHSFKMGMDTRLVLANKTWMGINLCYIQAERFNWEPVSEFSMIFSPCEDHTRRKPLKCQVTMWRQGGHLGPQWTLDNHRNNMLRCWLLLLPAACSNLCFVTDLVKSTLWCPACL